jgi:rfaE bifunctional protein kinase chain/domain
VSDTSEIAWLDDCLDGVSRVSVAVFGDFCLDAYWMVDPDSTEIAVETGLPIRRVREQRYSLGGAANVMANVCALGVREGRAVALIGTDTFGRLMLELLADVGAETSGVLACQEDWQTMVYAKPHFDGVESNRFDFGAFNDLSHEACAALAAEVDAAATRCDAVILNQQVPAGTSPAIMVEALNEVVASHDDCVFVVDSRDRAESYRAAVQKMNAHEAARICGDPRPLEEEVDADDCRRFARRIAEGTEHPVFITRGRHGILVADERGVHDVPAVEVSGPIDPVGAGDAVTACVAAVLGAGGDPVPAARVAVLAAAVTVAKLQVTGTASPEEIRELATGAHE